MVKFDLPDIVRTRLISSFTEPFDDLAEIERIRNLLSTNADESVVAAQCGMTPASLRALVSRREWMNQTAFRDLTNLPRANVSQVLTGSAWPGYYSSDRQLCTYVSDDKAIRHALPLAYFGIGKAGKGAVPSPEEYTEALHEPLRFVRTYEDLRALVVLHQRRNANTMSALMQMVELRVNPLQFEDTFGNLTKAVAKLEEACSEAQQDTNVRLNLILTVDWSSSSEEAVKVARGAVKAAQKYGPFGDFRIVVGFGITGDDRRGTPETFRDAASIAHSGGLIVTADSGLYTGADRVKQCIEILRPNRIGDCLAAAQNEGVLELLRERGVAVELCPGSYHLMQALEQSERVPIAAFTEAGVRVVIGSRDHTLFGTSLRDEYEALRRVHGFTDRQIADLAANSILCSGAAPLVQVGALRTLNHWMDPYSPSHDGYASRVDCSRPRVELEL